VSDVQAGHAIRAAKQQLAEITGLRPETVSGLDRNGEEGGWTVRVEALELSRVPDTMDVLGSYEVTLSGDGELTGFRRCRRYHRGAIEQEG
jgi:Gas vesicle synthesis protein GvpO